MESLRRKAAHDAQRLLVNAALRQAHAKSRQLTECGQRDAAAGRRRGRLARAINDLNELLVATRKIALQTRQRVAGMSPDGTTRRVSLHDPDARPIAKGRLGKPVEFGYKAQLVDNDGIVLDHDVQHGNSADAPRLPPAIERIHPRTGRPPRTSAPTAATPSRTSTTRCTRSASATSSSPHGQTQQGATGLEHRPDLRCTVKPRTECEGRISNLKRGYGWDRTGLDTIEGARIWTGHGVLTHNLIKISNPGGITASERRRQSPATTSPTARSQRRSRMARVSGRSS